MSRARCRPARGPRRGVTVVEAAVTFAIAGSLLAVAVPAFVRDLRASRFVEPSSGVKKIAEAAIAYAHDRPIATAFPSSAPLTPSMPPRGAREVDPAGAWDHPTWRALDFRPVAEGVPHAYAFGFDSTLGPTASSFVAHAHGDLDGDGITSTFELRGHADEDGAKVAPGMYVEAEVE